MFKTSILTKIDGEALRRILILDFKVQAVQ